MHPTDIDYRIWQVVALIPPGKVASYGQVAQLAGLPGYARQVGTALRKLPEHTKIPWHRVVNAQGAISLPAGSPSNTAQQSRLEAEGIIFNPGQRLSLSRFGWKP